MCTFLSLIRAYCKFGGYVLHRWGQQVHAVVWQFHKCSCCVWGCSCDFVALDHSYHLFCFYLNIAGSVVKTVPLLVSLVVLGSCAFGTNSRHGVGFAVAAIHGSTPTPAPWYKVFNKPFLTCAFDKSSLHCYYAPVFLLLLWCLGGSYCWIGACWISHT